MTRATHGNSITRRTTLLAGAVFAAQPLATRLASAATGLREFRLRAQPAQVSLVGSGYPQTPVWSYNGLIPGPELRVRQGERLRIQVENTLAEETTVHWHGVRVPNAMDGVPHLTQAPIAPGQTFTYEFDVPDAGTYWYHPHQRSFEQVARGLAGALIVEESTPLRVNRDIVWMLGDWRLGRDAALTDDFGNLHDVAHAGRIGNTVTVNGQVRDEFSVRAGERVRLRLINTANARIFGLKFDGHDPYVIAIDGQPVEPHRPAADGIIIGPGMRVDLLIEMSGQPATRHHVRDTFYRGREYRLIDLVYDQSEAAAENMTGWPNRLAPNQIPEPVLATAQRHEVILGGGMMGGMQSGMVQGRRMDMREMMRHGLAWTINGIAASEHVHEPMAVLPRGTSHIIQMKNETAWWHPMHLHGHVFRIISRNGEPQKIEAWQDTVLVGPREQVEVAFVADNPGDWMFHCHVLEHQLGGMMGTIRVL